MRRHTQRWSLACMFVAVTAINALVSCESIPVAVLSPSTQRCPEIPIQRLLERQLDALPSGWKTGEVFVHTDTDFTWAKWVMVVGLSPQIEETPSRSVHEEIHVFSNRALARQLIHASPATVNMLDTGFMPTDWSYLPPHADQFEIECYTASSRTSICRMLLQYQEYVLYIEYTPYDDLTSSHLQKLLMALDSEMGQYLDTSTLREGPRVIPDEWLKKLAPGERP